jgi:hypothetical protein
MQTQIEQIVQSIKNLPLEDLDKLQKAIEMEKQAKRQQEERDEKLREKLERFKKAQKWIAENREKYMNQWVCLYGGELIAHGEDALKVDAEAIAKGIESPFLARIVEEPKFFFGGGYEIVRD